MANLEGGELEVQSPSRVTLEMPEIPCFQRRASSV